MKKQELRLKHPRAIRWFHWLHFPLIFLMIWSGILIYWANDVYRVGVGGFTLLNLFPKPFYAALRIDHRLAEGIAWHFFLQWLFILNGVAYVAYLAFSGEWRILIPDRRSWSDAWKVTLHDLHLNKRSGLCPPRRSSAPAFEKFNGAQRIAYTAIILCGAGSVVTGYAIYKPAQLSWLVAAFGGYDFVRFIHFWLAMTYVIFFAVHLVQVARAGWNNLRSMVSGYEIK